MGRPTRIESEAKMSRRKHYQTSIIEPADEGLGGKAATACNCIIWVHDTTTEQDEVDCQNCLRDIKNNRT